MSAFPLDASAPHWTPGNCYAMARLSELAYDRPSEIEAGCAAWDFTDVKHFVSGLTDTQGFVAFRPDVAVLVFRGTEPDKLKDWLVDVSFAQRLMPDLGNVHGGFRRSYRLVHDQIVAFLTAWRDRPLFVTGHSRGGAEATLAMWFLFAHLIQGAQLYTFGSPRVVDPDAADKFSRRFSGRSWRHVNNSDGVPRVPTRMSNHWHIEAPIVADSDGVWCRGTGWWTRLLERVQGDWEAWFDGHDLAMLRDHKISEYVRVSKLNYERSLSP